MKETIYVDGKDRPLKEALEILTDEFISDGLSCGATQIDMANLLRELIASRDSRQLSAMPSFKDWFMSKQQANLSDECLQYKDFTNGQIIEWVNDYLNEALLDNVRRLHDVA